MEYIYIYIYPTRRCSSARSIDHASKCAKCLFLSYVGYYAATAPFWNTPIRKFNAVISRNTLHSNTRSYRYFRESNIHVNFSSHLLKIQKILSFHSNSIYSQILDNQGIKNGKKIFLTLK